MNKNKIFIILLIMLLVFVALALLFLNDSRYRYPRAYIKANIPIFSKAQVLSTKKETKDSKNTYQVNLVSTSSKEEVIEYFKGELLKRNWSGPKKLEEEIAEGVYSRKYLKETMVLYLTTYEENNKTMIFLALSEM